jgi:hypothetical protein
MLLSVCTNISIINIAAVAATVVAGGLFIPFTAIPNYWKWLSELGVFTHATKAAMLYIFKEIAYTCPQAPQVCDSPFTYCISLKLYIRDCKLCFPSVAAAARVLQHTAVQLAVRCMSSG